MDVISQGKSVPLHATKGEKKLHGKVYLVFSKVVFETKKLILLGWKAGSHSCARHSCCRGAGEKLELQCTTHCEKQAAGAEQVRRNCPPDYFLPTTAAPFIFLNCFLSRADLAHHPRA